MYVGFCSIVSYYVSMLSVFIARMDIVSVQLGEGRASVITHGSKHAASSD